MVTSNKNQYSVVKHHVMHYQQITYLVMKLDRGKFDMAVIAWLNLHSAGY
jgi:hypothetical protein